MSCHNEELREEQLLIERVKAGDSRAVDALVNLYKTPLFAFILRMTSHYETAEDIFQETWIRVIRSIHRFRGESKFSTWLFQIAVNRVRDEVRKTKGKMYVSIDDVTDTLSCSPDVDPYRLMKAKRVREMIDTLSPKMREAVILKYFHDFNDSEIAEIAGCPEGTVKSRLYKAAQLLKKKWEYAELNRE